MASVTAFVAADPPKAPTAAPPKAATPTPTVVGAVVGAARISVLIEDNFCCFLNTSSNALL